MTKKVLFSLKKLLKIGHLWGNAPKEPKRAIYIVLHQKGQNMPLKYSLLHKGPNMLVIGCLKKLTKYANIQ